MKRRCSQALVFGLMVLVMLGGVRTAQAKPAIWESAIGHTILSGGTLDDDDDNTANITFDTFSFPFAGTTYTGADTLSISSNGFVSLGGDNGDDCCDGDPSALVGDAFARIAPMWMDLDPGDEGGDVYINTFNDDADPAVDRIVITWAVGDNDCSGPECHVLVQVQLLENGTIIMGYNGIVLTGSVSDDVLIGVSPGGGAADPGGADFTAAIPFDSGSEPTIYEFFPDAGPPLVDVDNSNIVFTPNGSGGFMVRHTLLSTGGGGGEEETRITTTTTQEEDTFFGCPLPFGGMTGPTGGNGPSGGFTSGIGNILMIALVPVFVGMRRLARRLWAERLLCYREVYREA